MLVIRPNIFETNSSSMDYYNDYDDGLEHDSHAEQKIYIEFELEEGISDAETDNIINEMYEKFDDEANIDIFDSVLSVCELEDDYAYDIEIDGNVIKIVADIKVYIDYEGGYPQTRYEPGEPAEPYVLEQYGVPLKNEEFDKKKDIMLDLLKDFKDAGIRVAKITNIYGTEVDENEAIENIKY